MFWSVVRELNHGTNIEFQIFQRSKFPSPLFFLEWKRLFQNRIIHLRKPLKHLCKDCNAALQWKPTRKKHLDLKGVLPQNVLFTLMALTDLVDLGSAQTIVKTVPVYNIKRKIMKNTPLSGYKEDLSCSFPLACQYLSVWNVIYFDFVGKQMT